MNPRPQEKKKKSYELLFFIDKVELEQLYLCQKIKLTVLFREAMK